MLRQVIRAPFDDFNYELFRKILSKFDSKEVDGYYIWCANENLKKFFSAFKSRIPSEYIVIGLRDYQINDFTFFYNLAEEYSNHTFILLVGVEYHNQNNKPNLYFINWGGDITAQQHQYTNQCLPVLDKNFDSTKSFACLTRRAKAQRVLALNYIFSEELNTYGELSCLFDHGIKSSNELLSELGLDKKNYNQKLLYKLDSGAVLRDQHRFELMRDNNDISVVIDLVTNFNSRLLRFYKNTFVEIVNETRIDSTSLTEKTLNSIYACNFPILLAGKKAVEFLKSMGFDMFDDIIDHSYDNIDDPLLRIVSAIELNKAILSNPEYAKSMWLQSKKRFINNIQNAKNMYTWYEERALAQFNELL